MMTFERFKEIIADGLEKGELKVGKDLTEADLAIQYALGRMWEDNGCKPYSATPSEIAESIKKYCGFDVYDRCFSEGNADA